MPAFNSKYFYGQKQKKAILYNPAYNLQKIESPAAGQAAAGEQSMEGIMCRRKSTYITAILIPLAVGGLSALLSRNGMQAYRTLEKPPLSPPGVVFPIVWSILYILMGISSAMIWCSDNQEKTQALKLYAAQLAVNFFWSIFFFAFGWRLFAFFWLLLLLALTAMMIKSFYQIDKKAAYLQIPYLLWLLFAAYLNFGVWMLNR